nr:GNAT family N-acetyltransferase [Listeria costaricensis]
MDKRWQKNNLGEFLMFRVIAIVKENILPNVGATLLTVHALNESVGFYQKLGFEKTGDDIDKNTNMALILSEVLEK